MNAPTTIRLADYSPPAFMVETVELTFDLDPAATIVTSRLHMRRRAPGPIWLDGRDLVLKSIRLNGTQPDYELTPLGIRIDAAPDEVTLDIVVTIAPALNTELSGLYVSGGNFFTQCEAEGFRRITFFPDRPDVMARYTVTLLADPALCPVLLSNGNPAGRGTKDGRAWARWVDPHPKPGYLFALVAGRLASVTDSFTTGSGRHVDLAIYVRDGDQDRCGHAMRALKNAMKWDEERFGLEYDLDVFNIAAVSDFNMGAMENKGLNVFNTKYVLASRETATDGDYEGVETVIAHEYSHNWTGNRITCRDWFQLSLKEGLTVFRDQEFSADQGSSAVKRIRDVRRLRAAQFTEDAGPLRHPVRPDSYIAIDNFYTATVYQKGAELVRMIQTIIGRDAFRAGMDLYVARHDNSAATIEDFRTAMQDASGVDLAAFAAWYERAGTPELTMSDAWDEAARSYRLTLRQDGNLPIPVALGLLGPNGADLLPPRVEILTAAEQTLTFADLPARPVPSLLRGFSAPVKLHGLTRPQLRFLATHDSDPFVKWDSGQQYATAVLLDLVAAVQRREPLTLDTGLIEMAGAALGDPDPAFAAEALALPGEHTLADRMEVADVDAVHAARDFARIGIAQALDGRLRAIYARLTGIEGIGARALRNSCLARLDDTAMALAQFAAAGNMTDSLAALAVLADHEDTALAAFHARWHGDDLVIDKWFAIQATSRRADPRALVAHVDFDPRNPNRARSVIAAFASGNPVLFHALDGSGYRFLADMVLLLDPMNGQLAARMVQPLGQWRRHDAGRQVLMQAELRNVLAAPGLSAGTFEMASKGLG